MIFAGLSLLTFVFFKDTFRRERSLSYQSALRRATAGILEREKRQKTRVEEKEKDSSPPTPSSPSKKSSKEGPDQLGLQPELKGITRCIPPEDLEAGKSGQESRHLTLADVRLDLRDINPIRPIGSVLRRPNNVMILVPSGESRFFFAPAHFDG